MKKLTKMFAVMILLLAPLCFTACQEEEAFEPTYYNDSDLSEEPKDDLD